jgi:hypothetical protein
MEIDLYIPSNTHKLIRLVHQRQALWDRADVEHSNVRRLNHLWEQVAKELNCTSDAARNKWRSLRDSFTKRLKKMPMSTTGDAYLEFSKHTTWPYFEHLYFLKDQYTPHVSSGGIPPNEEKTSRDDQADTQDGGLEISKYGGSGKELKPSVEEPKRGICDPGLEFSNSSTLPNFKHLCPQKDRLTPHAGSKDLPHKEKKILRADQTGSGERALETSHFSGSGKEVKPTVEMPKTRNAVPGPEFSKSSNLCPQNDRLTFHAGSKDIPRKEKNTSRADQYDSQDGGLETSQFSGSGKELMPSDEVPKRGTTDPGLQFSKSLTSRRFLKHICIQKVQVTFHAGNTELPPKEKKILRADQTGERGIETSKFSSSGKELTPSDEVPKARTDDPGLEFSKNSTSPNFKHPCHQKESLTSHAGSKDLPRKEKSLRADQMDSQDGGLETSQFSASGKEHKPTAEVPKTRTDDPGLEFSKNSTSPNFKHPCPQKDRLTSHAGSKDLPRKEEKSLRADQMDSQDGGLETSQFSASGKEHKPTAELQKRTGGPGLEFSNISTLPNFKHICPKNDRLTSHASSKDLPSKKRKAFRNIQADIRDGEAETLQHNGDKKKLKLSAKVPKRETENRGLKFCDASTSPNLNHLCLQKDHVRSHTGSKNLPPKEKKILWGDQTESRERGLQTSQFSGSGKELEYNAHTPKTRIGVPRPEFSKGSTSPNFKHLCPQKNHLTSRAICGDIPPKEEKTSSIDQTDTRDTKLESSKWSKFDGAPADILKVETEASGPLSPNLQHAGLSLESHTSKHSTRRSHRIDFGNATTQTETPILKLSEDEHKVRDDDTIFFESLIPHFKGLSPARTMLLRIKIQELIYNLVYNEEF